MSATTARIEFAGKTYEASGLTKPVKEAFEAWVRSRAIGVLSDLRGSMPADEYEREKGRLFDDIACGKFGFHGSTCRAAMKTPDGNLTVSALLFGCSEDEMVRLAAARPAEVKAVLGRVAREAAPGNAAGRPTPAARAKARAEKR